MSSGRIVVKISAAQSGDPLRAGQPGIRSPEGVEREAAQVALEPLAQPVGRAGDAEDLVAVGPVMGLRGHADLDRRPLVEPPEELGRAERQAALASPARRAVT